MIALDQLEKELYFSAECYCVWHCRTVFWSDRCGTQIL